MGQEPWDPPKIKEFTLTKFNARFKLFGKIEVNGENCSPVFQFLRQNSELKQSDGTCK
jgi:glutathione peroxidase